MNCVFECLGVCLSQGSEYQSKKDDASSTRPVDSTISTPFSYIETLPSTPCLSKELNVSPKLRSFTYNEIKQATRGFRPDCLLGEGGFGSVYKGWIHTDSGREIVAIKVLNLNKRQGHKEWLAEINYLGGLNHENLVKLIGYCHEDAHRVLVYEFLPFGSLEDHLFNATRSTPLSWDERMNVALGSARGLAFLHENEKPVIFRDFKPSNILLDRGFNAKLSDFGHAKDAPEGDQSHVSTRVIGTRGYSAPEYLMTGHLTKKSDVFSYGVVLLELITGRKSIDKTRKSWERNLVEWARRYMANPQSFHVLVDPRLEAEKLPTEAVKKVIQLAARCLDCRPKLRPKMSEVVEILEHLPNLTRSSSARPKMSEVVEILEHLPNLTKSSPSPNRSQSCKIPHLNDDTNGTRRHQSASELPPYLPKD